MVRRPAAGQRWLVQPLCRPHSRPGAPWRGWRPRSGAHCRRAASTASSSGAAGMAGAGAHRPPPVRLPLAVPVSAAVAPLPARAPTVTLTVSPTGGSPAVRQADGMGLRQEPANADLLALHGPQDDFAARLIQRAHRPAWASTCSAPPPHPGQPYGDPSNSSRSSLPLRPAPSRLGWSGTLARFGGPLWPTALSASARPAWACFTTVSHPGSSAASNRG